MRKIREIFDITFHCNKDIERGKYRHRGLVLVVEASGRIGKLRIDIRGLTPDRIGRALCEVEGQISRNIHRDKARELVNRVMEILRKELTVDEFTAVLQHYRQAWTDAVNRGSPVAGRSAAKTRKKGKIAGFIRPKQDDP